MRAFIQIDDVWNYLDQIPMFSKVGASASNFGLDNIRDFCSSIVNPQDQFKSIHVSGTNGKGTVTLLLESIYRCAGFKTGAFTSPHLLKYNERVKIDGEDISDDKILEFFQRYSNQLEEIQLTYFEISTALAFWAFKDAKVDIALIEAGLGGRLDSTNIIDPECSVITSIGLDHQAILGDTKIEIAREKAGIIKPGKPVIIGNIEGDELNEILKKAESEQSEAVLSGLLDPKFDNTEIQLNSLSKPIKTNFIESINAHNVATVKSVVDTLQNDFPIDEATFIESIELFPGIPARFEKLHKEYDWYFSGAHNPDAIQSLFDGLNRFNDRKVIFILSALKDKVSSKLLSPFEEFENLFFYEQEGERAAKVEQIREYLSVESIDESNFKRILNDLKHEVVIFAGSFYFYPIVRRWLTHLN